MPIRRGDGTGIESIRKGDGTQIAEVRKGDGTVLWQRDAIPDSAVVLYDSRELTGYSDGQTVDFFTATVGNDFPALNTPSYVPSGIAGNPSISYDGASDGHSGTNVTVQQPYTIYTVIDAQFSNLSTFQSIAGSASSTVLHEWSGLEEAWEHFAGQNFYGSSDSSISIFSAYIDGSNSVLREDGSRTNTGNAGSNPFDLGSIGYWVEGNDRHFTGDIGYVELHDGEPTNGFEAREQEIIDDWGLSV